MSRRGLLLAGALILLPFLIVGLVRMNRKAARRAKYSATITHAAPQLARAEGAHGVWQIRGNGERVRG